MVEIAGIVYYLVLAVIGLIFVTWFIDKVKTVWRGKKAVVSKVTEDAKEIKRVEDKIL